MIMTMMTMIAIDNSTPADPDSSGVCAALLTLCACLLILVTSFWLNLPSHNGEIMMSVWIFWQKLAFSDDDDDNDDDDDDDRAFSIKCL